MKTSIFEFDLTNLGNDSRKSKHKYHPHQFEYVNNEEPIARETVADIDQVSKNNKIILILRFRD